MRNVGRQHEDENLLVENNSSLRLELFGLSSHTILNVSWRYPQSMGKLIVVAAAIALLSLQAVRAQVENIHFGSTGNPLNGLTITWKSSGLQDSIRWGYTQSFEQGIFAGERRDNYAGNLFDYTYPPLKASSTIYYGIKAVSWGSTRAFKTSRDTLSTRFKVLAGGDNQPDMSAWRRIADALAGYQVDFCLYMGDIVNNGRDSSHWEGWYEHGDEFIATHLVYHCIGNHETSEAAQYLNQFVLPGSERYYSFEYGNALFICLDSEYPDNAEQYNWLKSTLQNASHTWKIVWFHKPFFTGTPSRESGMDSYRSTWWKAFDDYGVDVVVNGHQHYYCRSRPINLNANPDSLVVDEYGSEPGQGRLQIITGGYGASLYTSRSWYSYVAARAVEYHYCVIDIDDSVLTVEAYRVDGQMMDEVSLVKNNDTPVFTSVRLLPSDTVALPVSNVQWSARALDQYGNAVDMQPAFSWNVDAAAGSITAHGLFTAATDPGGPYTVEATAKLDGSTKTGTASIEIVNEVRLVGTIIGNGKPIPHANGYEAALDGYLSTFPDLQDGPDLYVGYDFGEKHIVTQIRYMPRPGWAQRMENKTFEISDDGKNWTVIHTIEKRPPEGQFTTANVSGPVAACMIRYNGTGGYLNVNEIEFRGRKNDGNRMRARGAKQARSRFAVNTNRSGQAVVVEVLVACPHTVELIDVRGRIAYRKEGAGRAKHIIDTKMPGSGLYILSYSAEEYKAKTPIIIE